MPAKIPINFEDRTSYLRKDGREYRDKTATSGNALGVISKAVSIYSEGVRLSATIWKPDGTREQGSPLKKLPAILLCHGWGGIRDHLDSSYAPTFAAEGFICLTFDYRTWGDSDGILLPKDGMPEMYDSMSSTNTVANLNCVILKRVADPEWQLRDIKSCLSFLRNMESVDKENIGMSMVPFHYLLNNLLVILKITHNIIGGYIYFIQYLVDFRYLGIKHGRWSCYYNRWVGSFSR